MFAALSKGSNRTILFGGKVPTLFSTSERTERMEVDIGMIGKKE
jgi:hypothetical protein